jgi:hypothetical protein
VGKSTKEWIIETPKNSIVWMVNLVLRELDMGKDGNCFKAAYKEINVILCQS